MNDSVNPEQTPGAAPAAGDEAPGQTGPEQAGLEQAQAPGGGNAQGAAQEPGSPEPDLALAAAEQEINRLRDEALRAHAEMENVRRRAERDVTNARKFALERVMTDLLEVVDSMERGLLAADAEQVSVEQLKEGTELTHRLLDKVLARHGLTEIQPNGEVFNPEYHEALSMLPTNEAEPNTVVQVVQKGYLLNDRLIRPARVIVAQQA